MSATSQPTTFSDLYTDLQNRVRETTGVTATQNIAKRAINTALQDMHVGTGEKFPWAERHAVLVTQDDYSTGTVSISQGSTTLTGSGTAWNTANAFGVNNVRAGGKVVISGGEEVYEVSSVASDTSLTLTSAYTQADASATTYVYFEDEYALASDFLKPVDAQFFDEDTDIELIGRREFRLRYPRNRIIGKPLVGTLVQRNFSGDTTPVRKIRFWKPPDDFYSIPYNYVTSQLVVQSNGTRSTSLVNDDDEPIVPLAFRHAIVFHALYHHFRDMKDDQRSQEVKAEYVEILSRVLNDQEVGSSRPQIRPRLGQYRGSAAQPYKRRRGQRIYTTGSRFDEIR